MRQLSVVGVWLVALLFGGGCVTHIAMKRVLPGENPRGVRVYLPAPFVVGRPTPDGKIEYTVELFPDPDQEYAIDAWTLMAKQKTVISRTIEMYLKKADLAQDTTAVAKALADAAGDVGKSAVSTLVQQQQAAAQLQAKAAAAKPLGGANADTANKEKETSNADPYALKEAQGPVLYRIVEDTATGGIRLDPIDFRIFNFNGIPLAVGTRLNGRQLPFETWGKKPVSTSEGQISTSKPIAPKVLTKMPVIVDRYQGTITTNIEFEQSVDHVEVGSSKLVNTDTKQEITKISDMVTFGKADKKIIPVTWNKDTPNGNYTVTAAVVFSDQKLFKIPLDFAVK